MSLTIELNINGRVYPIASSEAEAPRIRELGRQLHERAAKLQAQFSGVQVTDAHLMVLLNLMTMDELSEAQQGAKTAQVPAPKPVAEQNNDQELMVKAVEHLTTRVISIADRLKAA